MYTFSVAQASFSPLICPLNPLKRPPPKIGPEYRALVPAFIRFTSSRHILNHGVLQRSAVFFGEFFELFWFSLMSEVIS